MLELVYIFIYFLFVCSRRKVWVVGACAIGGDRKIPYLLGCWCVYGLERVNGNDLIK